MANNDLPETIKLGATEYDVSKMNDAALAQLRGIQFCDQQIQQLQNEWAVADTARMGYEHALKREVVTNG